MVKKVLLPLVLLLGITQAKTITIHFKVYNDQILNHTAQTGIITPDTTQVYPGARIVFQELDTIQGRYINIAEATTNNNGEATITAEITPINENPNTPRQTLEEKTIKIYNQALTIQNNTNQETRIKIYTPSLGTKLYQGTLKPQEKKHIETPTNNAIWIIQATTPNKKEIYKTIEINNQIINTEKIYQETLKPIQKQAKTSKGIYTPDTTYRAIIYTPDTTIARIIYPWMPEDTPRDTTLKTILTNPTQPIKNNTDTATTTREWFLDFWYNDVNPQDPIGLHYNPRWIYPIKPDETPVFPTTIAIIYSDPADTVNFPEDSTNIAKTYGTSVNDSLTWNWYTGLPLTRKIIYIIDTTGTVGPSNVPHGMLLIERGTANLTFSANDPDHYTIYDPWQRSACMTVTVVEPDILYTESKWDGQTEVYNYLSVYNEPAGTNWPTDIDAVNMRIGFIEQIGKAFGLEDGYLPGTIFEKTLIQQLLNGQPEP